MRKTNLLFLSAAAVMGAIAVFEPASADVHQLGTVNISADHYTPVSWSRFEGPVYRLRFFAENDTVDCEHITVIYRDQTVHTVFSGGLEKGSTETITFPEGDNRIREVVFACKAQSVDGARIALSAVSKGDPESESEDWSRPAHLMTDAPTTDR